MNCDWQIAVAVVQDNSVQCVFSSHSKYVGVCLVFPGMILCDLTGLCPPRKVSPICLWSKGIRRFHSDNPNDRVISRVIFFTYDLQFKVGSDSLMGSGGFFYICQNAIFGSVMN